MYLTVFTATFNRYGELKRVYECLLTQSYKNFEWLIVDDGSTDNTEALVEGWINDEALRIRYTKQINQGKHVAFNKGVQMAKGEMFVSLDSDDVIVPNALELFVHYWNNIESNSRDKYKGLAFRCMDSKTKEILGQPLPSRIWDCDDRNFRLKYRIRGEFMGFNRVDVLKKYSFPIYDDRTRFCPENIVWYEMAKEYLTRYVDIPVRYYYRDSGNALTGKSHNRSFSNYFLWKYYINNLSGYIIYSPKIIIKGYIGITMDGFISGRKLATIIKDCNGLLNKMLVVLLSPIGYFLSRR